MPSTDSRKIFAETIAEIQKSLHNIAMAGCSGLNCSQQSLDILARWNAPAAPRKESLGDIRNDLGDCRRCKLWPYRNHIVFGEGHPAARLVFVGEGPGFEEDQQGRPFVGPAGQLLTRIIHAIGLSRDQVYICNIIKCRPPGNRNPEPDEIDACEPFLRRQLKTIAPEVVCALGAFAAQTILGSKDPISRLRGRFYDYMGFKVMPTYHPAYLLRNPEKKRDVWDDMKRLMHEMGLVPPVR
jgi:DNA polymerase